MCTLIHTTQDAGFTSMNECAGQWLCQQDASSTEEHLFEAFCFRDQLSEDYDPAFTLPTSHGNTFMTTWPVPERHEELDVGMLNADPKYSAGPTSQCTLNSSWEPSTDLTSEDAVHPKPLMQGTPAAVEAELEEDIQREIEAELKKEISLLSQKLAVLQARHGAQRMMEGPLPAVLSCPVTPVLTPRDSKETNVQSSNLNQSDAGAIGTRHRRGGPIIAAKQSRPRSEWKASMRPDIPSPGMQQNEGMIHEDCSPQSNDYGQARAHEEFNYEDEHSLEGTPSSGSLNSNITDYVMKDPTIQNSHGVPCPRVYPNNSRRFDWVKTLRSGETGSRVSSETSVSSDKKSLKIPKTKRLIETKAECASKNQRDTTTGNWTTDLSDMTEMLENRLSDLAIRTTMACVQIPAPQDLECTSSCRHVSTTKHAKYLEPAADKSTKDLGSDLLAEEDYGCLDRRTVLHLMKAGLKRGPIRKKIVHQSPYSKPRPVRTCNTHKDATNGKHGDTTCEKVSPEKQTQTDELKGIPQNTELVSSNTIKTECKTFVQSLNDRRKSLLHCDDSDRLHGEATRNGNSNMLVQKNQVLSTQEKISQSQISILGSKEKQHPVKTTYMRIIELVADTGNQHSAKKSTHGSRQCLASDKGSLSSLLLEVKHRAEDKTFKHDKGHISNITDTSSLTTSRLRENIASAFKKGSQETIKKTSQNQKIVSRLSEQLSPESHTESMDCRMGCKSLPMTTLDVMRDGVKETIHKEEQTECLATNRPILAKDMLRSAIFREKACPHENWSPELIQDQEQLQEFDGKHRAISPSSLNGENHTTDNDSAEASRPAISSIRARLKELIDALEKERLRLPKIKTGIEASISTSPRDSGRVKRIAERLQLINLKVDETPTPSDLHNNGQIYPEMTVKVITASCTKMEAKCIKSAEAAQVHDRQGQTIRKKTLQQQVLRVRRSGKQSRRAKDSNIQKNLNQDKKCTKKLRKKNTTNTGNEIEGLNLESIWCLVEKLEDVRSSSAMASRTPARHMRGQHCEEGA